MAVHTKHSKVCTKLTKSQHSPVQLKQVRLVSSLLNGPSTKVVYLEFLWPKIHSLWLFSWKKSVRQNMDKYKPIRLLGFTSGLPCHRIIYYNATRHGEVSCKWPKNWVCLYSFIALLLLFFLSFFSVIHLFETQTGKPVGSGQPIQHSVSVFIL